MADDERFLSRRDWFFVPYSVVGFVYIVAGMVTSFQLPFLPNWGTQNLVSFGYSLALMLGLIKLLRANALRARPRLPGWSSRLTRAGQAS